MRRCGDWFGGSAKYALLWVATASVMTVGALRGVITMPRRTCTMYLTREDDYCQRTALWRPASIPMNPDWWFCKQHAKQIAQEEGTYGIYRHNGEVEEVPLPADGVTPAKPDSQTQI
jgi:hypothetical protein